MERLPGYIAVGGLSWTDDYCEEEPPLASSQGSANFFFTVTIACNHKKCLCKQS